MTGLEGLDITIFPALAVDASVLVLVIRRFSLLDQRWHLECMFIQLGNRAREFEAHALQVLMSHVHT